MLTEAQLLALHLTAHFSEEDYPYEWQVLFFNHFAACVLMSSPLQVDELAFQGVFHPETKANVVTGLPSLYESSNLHGSAAKSSTLPRA